MKPLPLEHLIRCEEFALKALRETSFASHHIVEASDNDAASLQVREDVDSARRSIHAAKENLGLMLDALDTHLAENEPAPEDDTDIITPDQSAS